MVKACLFMFRCPQSCRWREWTARTDHWTWWRHIWRLLRRLAESITIYIFLRQYQSHTQDGIHHHHNNLHCILSKHYLCNFIPSVIPVLFNTHWSILIQIIKLGNHPPYHIYWGQCYVYVRSHCHLLILYFT